MPNYDEMRQPILDAINNRFYYYHPADREQTANELFTLTKVYALLQDFTRQAYTKAAYMILERAFRNSTHDALDDTVRRLNDIYEMWKGGIYHVDC